MKKYLLIMFSALLCGALFTNCGGASKLASPEKVAEKYLDAFIKMDFPTMKSLATEAEQADLEKKEAEYNKGISAEKQEIVDKLLEGTNSVQPAVIDEENPDKATVKILHTSPDGKECTWTINLLKEQGAWKVSKIKIK